MKFQALIIEDHFALAQALASKVEAAGFAASVVPTLALAGQALAEREPDLILLDLGLPDGSGLDFIKQWPGEKLPITAIITAHGDLEHAIQAKKTGVQEFLVKPVDFRALEQFLNLAQSSLLEQSKSASFSAGFIGAAPSMRPVFQQIARACSSSSPVLICGPDGSGRSHVARLIHQHAETEQQLQVVDCAAVAAWRSGWELVEGGWVLFDRIDKLPIPDQVWLAEQLNRSSAESRLMAISAEDGLLAGVRQHQFHPDLYYRLQGVQIDLPALKQRLEDLPSLCSLFAGELRPANPLEFDPSAIELLSAYSWPGNVRELRRMIAQLQASSNSPQIQASDLTGWMKQEDDSSRADDPLRAHLQCWLETQVEANGEFPEYRELFAEVESRLLHLLLDHFDHKPSVMAQALKLNRSTLRRRLRDLGLQQ